MARYPSKTHKKYSSLTLLVKKLMDEDNRICGYLVVEGVLDVGDEDHYELTLLENGHINFVRGWAIVDLIVPMWSRRFLEILQFLKGTDNQIRAESIDPLIQALDRATRHGGGHLIKTITLSWGVESGKGPASGIRGPRSRSSNL